MIYQYVFDIVCMIQISRVMRSRKGRDFMQITIREPGSAITHFIGMMMAIFAATPLMVKVAMTSDHTAFIAMAVFIGSMVCLYGASAIYHSLNVKDRILKVFRKLDHMMIFVLIAGSYTPVCLIRLRRQSRLHPAGRCVGHRHRRHGHQSLLDHLPEVVFFHYLYRHGMGMSGRLRHTLEHASQKRFPVASCRRNHLYRWRRHLCTQAAYL